MSITMTPSLRRFALTAHVTCSVGLLGSIATFLALAIAGLTSHDEQMLRFAYPAMELIAKLVIVPLAFASLLTGLVQSLGTSWGLFRHYWVVAKLSITVFATVVLLAKMQLISHAARLAEQTILHRAELHDVGLQLAVHAGGGLLVLLTTVILSVYKPRGLTAYGRRMRQEQGAPLQQLHRPSQLLSLNPSSNIGIWSSGGSITITLRRTYVLGFIIVVAVVHMVVLHLASGGLGHH